MKNGIAKLAGELNSTTVLLEQAEKKKEQLDNELGESEEALEILQAVAQEIQQQAHKQLSRIVTKCLCVVFDEPYSFEIRFDRKRNRTEGTLLLKRGDLELESPMDEAGGGVIDVAAFALRVAVVLLSRPQKRRVFFLDEPFKFVHPAERRPRLVAMMEMLSEDFDVQFIMVTGIDELVTGHVIHLK